jgi:hypothetical protein
MLLLMICKHDICYEATSMIQTYYCWRSIVKSSIYILFLIWHYRNCIQCDIALCNPQSSNQNSVYDGNCFLIRLFLSRSTDNYSYCKTWPFDHKTFEHEFVVILEEKKTANTLSNKYFVLIGQLWSKIKYIHKLKIN